MILAQTKRAKVALSATNSIVSRPINRVPRFVTVVGFFYLRQRRGPFDRRLTGGASNSEMASIDKSSSSSPPLSPRSASKREAGGGCPPSGCTHTSNRCDFSDADCSTASTSSCYPPRCGYSPDCRSCAMPLKSILKRRKSCCRCTTSHHCLCQPMPRGCNCPPPVHVDARACRDCSCECPSAPECACPPSERRFPKANLRCPNARLCCPFPRLPPGPKCHCARCQPCLPPPCDPCASGKCPIPRSSCRPCSPYPPCPSCRPPCKRLTSCGHHRQRSPSCRGTGQSLKDVGRLKQHATEDYNSHICICTLDHIASIGMKSDIIDKGCDPISDEKFVKDPKNLVKPPEEVIPVIPPKSVEPDLPDAPQGGEFAHENTAELLAEYISEKPANQS